MKYNGYEIGPVIRQLRKDRSFTLDKVSELTQLSVSSIKQIEQGGRNMSMNTLYLLMEAYGVDANTILDMRCDSIKHNFVSVDEQINKLLPQQQEYFSKIFLYMLQQAEQLAS